MHLKLIFIAVYIIKIACCWSYGLLSYTYLVSYFPPNSGNFVYQTVSNKWSVMFWGHVWSSFASNCFKLILVEEETSDQNLTIQKMNLKQNYSNTMSELPLKLSQS